MLQSPEKIIQAVYPQLADSPLLEVFLSMAAAQTDRGFFGGVYSLAVAYRACHLFAVTGQSSSPAMGLGQVASMSEGSLSVSFATGANAESGLDTTKYGKLLQALIKSRPSMGVNSAGSL